MTRDFKDHTIFGPGTTMKLANSASEQNVYFTYVCLVSGIKPNDNAEQDYRGFQIVNTSNDEPTHDHEPIQVERSKALHELIESHRKLEKEAEEKQNSENESSTAYPTTTSGAASELSENSESNFISCDNPNVLKLTKMKWLTEDREGPDSSSPSLSPSSSRCTVCSKDSDDNLSQSTSFDDKYLSTILRLDKEHNLFGLSNIAIVGVKPSKLKRKDDEKAVFHQTAIVQICCGKNCCKHKSITDLPSSLKCSGCKGCCVSSCRFCCMTPCEALCDDPPCTPLCTSCPKGKCKCKLACIPSKCAMDCGKCFGMRISLNKKPKYEPLPVEVTPRSSCVLKKPMAARSCHHLPQCVPPSSCFPYLMPCYWPARPSAPCSVPARCFHNPPCLAPRKHQCPIPQEYKCPKSGKCDASDPKKKCPNATCLGKSPITKKELEQRFKKK